MKHKKTGGSTGPVDPSGIGGFTDKLLHSGSKRWFFVLLLVTFITVLIYINTFNVPFFLDDHLHISTSKKIRSLSNFFPPDNLIRSREIVNLTFAVNYAIGGLTLWQYHLTNTIIHAVNGILVFMLSLALYSLFLARSPIRDGNNDAGRSRSIYWMSLFSALVFISHPVQTQSVTYIVQRYTSLGALFFFLSLLFYLKMRQAGGREAVLRPDGGKTGRQRADSVKGKGAASEPAPSGRTSFLKYVRGAIHSEGFFGIMTFLCGALSFLSKENTVTLPLIVLLIHFFIFRHPRGTGRQRIVPTVVLLVAWALFILYLFGLMGALTRGTFLKDVASVSAETDQVSRWVYLVTQFNVIVIYIRLLFLPFGQNLDYMYPFKSGFFDDYTPFAFAALLALLVLSLVFIKKKPILCFSVLWFFITLSIESSIIPIRDAIFEHRLYIPLFGFSFLLGSFLLPVLRRKMEAALILASVYLLFLGSLTVARNTVWGDPVTMWSDIIRKSPHNYRAYNQLGLAYVALGRADDAIRQYDRALRIKPDDFEVLSNMGAAWMEKGDMQKAQSYMERAAKTDSGSLDGEVNRAIAFGKQGHSREALDVLQGVITKDPDHAPARYAMGVILAKEGDYEEAERQFRECSRLDPQNWKAQMALGGIFLSRRLWDKADEAFESALKINSGDVNILNSLGLARFYRGNLEGALSAYREVLRNNPEREDTRVNLSGVLMGMGRFEEAERILLEVLKANPENAIANYNMGRIHEQAGRGREALKYYEAARRQLPNDREISLRIDKLRKLFEK